MIGETFRCPYCAGEVDPRDDLWTVLPSDAVAHYGCHVDAEDVRAEHLIERDHSDA